MSQSQPQSQPQPQSKPLHIGLCGAGLGGLAAAIALSKTSCQVTVLESASELGEIGAGIQVTPNVSRLLIKWGVADVIVENLVEFEELNMRRWDGVKVGYTKVVEGIKRDLGFPWWVVHRAHLHAGLVKVARKNGAEILINSRVKDIEYQNTEKVTVITERGSKYTFDLLIGSDGVKSIVRKTLFPQIKPSPPTGNAAYRALVPYSQIRADPIARELIEDRLTMEVWMAEKSYIITYSISGGKVFNLVLSHHLDRFVDEVEDVDIEELRQHYKDYDPRIKRVVDMIQSVQRWPLLVTGPLESWSSPQKNVVLMGDAAHSMVNHMAQGAATAMEDGAFLARCIAQVVQGHMRLSSAVSLYEKARMPKANLKQQVSFLNGVIWQLPDGPFQRARDKAMRPELDGKPFVRSSNLYGDPRTVLEVYGYDAEEHADEEIYGFLHGTARRVPETGIVREVEERIMGWFMPGNGGGSMKVVKTKL